MRIKKDDFIQQQFITPICVGKELRGLRTLNSGNIYKNCPEKEKILTNLHCQLRTPSHCKEGTCKCGTPEQSDKTLTHSASLQLSSHVQPTTPYPRNKEQKERRWKRENDGHRNIMIIFDPHSKFLNAPLVTLFTPKQKKFAVVGGSICRPLTCCSNWLAMTLSGRGVASQKGTTKTNQHCIDSTTICSNDYNWSKSVQILAMVF